MQKNETRPLSFSYKDLLKIVKYQTENVKLLEENIGGITSDTGRGRGLKLISLLFYLFSVLGGGGLPQNDNLWGVFSPPTM